MHCNPNHGFSLLRTYLTSQHYRAQLMRPSCCTTWIASLSGLLGFSVDLALQRRESSTKHFPHSKHKLNLSNQHHTTPTNLRKKKVSDALLRTQTTKKWRVAKQLTTFRNLCSGHRSKSQMIRYLWREHGLKIGVAKWKHRCLPSNYQPTPRNIPKGGKPPLFLMHMNWPQP